MPEILLPRQVYIEEPGSPEPNRIVGRGAEGGVKELTGAEVQDMLPGGGGGFDGTVDPPELYFQASGLEVGFFGIEYTDPEDFAFFFDVGPESILSGYMDVDGFALSISASGRIILNAPVLQYSGALEVVASAEPDSGNGPRIWFDMVEGELKVKFPNGTIKTIATDAP